ncbi:MAG TPA: isochorismatase [Chromatiaceae bacterium]|jgi:nicotinamidase-related amidase|nr:MAG: hypothetical protein N838_17315 [Thiohalocapsa sp. PB-PSB1]QQO54002.1 MAG: isochorismatase family protein [Thiohalocapsa sp. PB-PSB1]HBG93724.1 isochorismatase [Chromatiaceae bacterium]HCS88791.1 isochorismatase [Chromatiaceae bacterium]
MSIHQAAMPLCQSALSQLLIVDVQERLAAVMPTEELATTLTNINRLTQVARELDIPTIFTEQYPQGLGPTVDSVREHLPQSASATEKTSFSCCTAAGFERTLTNQSKRKQVILVGMEAHICILQSASGLLRWGYQVFVAADAVCSRYPASHQNALERMRQCGIQVADTESIVFEWVGDSSHEKFRDISRLFK